MSNQEIDITTLAQNLKKGVARKSTASKEVRESQSTNEFTPEKKEEKPKSEKKDSPVDNKNKTEKDYKKRTSKKEKTENQSSFYDVLEKINGLEGFDHKGMVYVDSDIHDVLKKLKNSTKLKISSLANYLLAKWITEHQDAINEIINKKKKNKFLT